MKEENIIEKEYFKYNNSIIAQNDFKNQDKNNNNINNKLKQSDKISNKSKKKFLLSIVMIKNKVYCSKKKENEIYISSKKRNFTKMYFDRAYELFQTKNIKEVFIYGLGVCTNSAVKIALIICEGISNVKVDSVDTSTVNLTDDFIDEENAIVIFYLNFKIFHYLICRATV